MAAKEENYVVAVQDAREHALLAAVRATAVGLQDVEAWSKAALRKEPHVIYDLNGQALFYDFEVRRGEHSVGYVRVAANAMVGTPEVAFELGARHWSYDAAVKALGPKVRRQFPRAQASEPRLICYSYPKLGVM